ncbi:MAG: serine kinase [Salibaculum sp.]|uniref:HPr kinase/phosphorylase n=1 Tax=Roseovarius halophilus (ex Wu et al. 2025) TaxID=3376060 RepID=UPI002870A338|nr:serine kinase [Salibaculum sp.]MDR9426823.1 serine kinase [Salibaculum sp.]MDR9481376.1 serine kinase [Salibaculum sp.]
MSGAASQIHATTVAVSGLAVVITGPSGSGKSALGLSLMALGAGLVSDDITCLRLQQGAVVARAPAGAPAAIEARGVGLLRADPVGPTPVALVIDMTQEEALRLPPWRVVPLLGQDMPCLHKVARGCFPAAILQYIQYGRFD